MNLPDNIRSCRSWCVVIFYVFPFLLLPILFPAAAFPGTGNYPFEHLSLEQGLSQSTVLDILQDRRGFLWFSTQDGLNMFDGYTFTVFRHDPQDSSSLASSALEKIYEDRSGNIWVSMTMSGIDRLDRATGKAAHFVHTASGASLSSNRVTAFCQDSHGTIWIGTGHGLNRFDSVKNNFQRYIFAGADSQSTNSITVIYEDRSGLLWLGTRKGLKRFDAGANRFVALTGDTPSGSDLSGETINCLFEDRGGALWIGTSGGISRYDRNNGRLFSLRHHPFNRNTLCDDMVLKIAQAPDGSLCFGTSHGMSMYNPRTDSFDNFFHDPADNASMSSNIVAGLWIDEYNLVWTICGSGELDVLDRSAGGFSRIRHDPSDPFSLGVGKVVVVYEDRGGTIWLGMNGGGINKLSRKKLKFRQYSRAEHDSQTLSSKSITAIYEDHDGIIWLGTSEGGLDRYDRKRDRVTHYEERSGGNGPAENSITAICQDNGGTFWIGTLMSGLDEFDQAHNRWKHHQASDIDTTAVSNNMITALLVDHLGTLWVGTMKGLNRYDAQTGRFRRFLPQAGNTKSIGDAGIRCLYEDRSGTLWIGTFAAGFSKFDRGNLDFNNYQYTAGSRGIHNRWVESITEDRNGLIWLGTYSAGLNRFDPARQSFSQFTEKEGLPNNRIMGILEDRNGNLWLSTTRGLSKFNPSSGTFRNYDYTDGLQSNEFNPGAYCGARSGEFFFGGINGLNSFFPDSIKDNEVKPPVALIAFKKFDKAILFPQPVCDLSDVILSYDDNFFSLEFAALDFTAPMKNRYAYRMEGFDRDWIFSGTRHFASYTNLDPGTYTFYFRGTNNDGVWADGTPLRITITPPFWRTIWFRLGAVLFIFGVLYGSVRYRVRSIQMQKTNLEKIVEERTHELQAARDLLEHRVQARTQELQRINESLRQEIFERQTAQEQVQELKEFNENLVHTMAEGIVVQDTDGLITYVNPAVGDLLGYEPEELIGKHWTELVPSNQHHIVDAADRRRQEGLADHYELQLIRKDGLRITLLVGGSPLFKNDRLIGVIAVFTDISALKKAEEQVRDQAALIDKAHDAIIVCDLDGQISYWNKGAESTYGWTAGEASRKKIDDLLHREDGRPLTEALRLVLERGEWSGELHQVNRAGGMVIVSSRWTLLRDAEAYPRSIMMINTDVTEKVKLEMQFLRSQRMESIGTLAGGIAHDLNNVLAPILLAVRMLGKSFTDEGNRKVVESLEKSATRGAEIVKQVLTFARGVEGKQESIQPGSLIEEMAILVRETFPKSIRLSTILHDGLWTSIGDPTQLHQVLLNLCVNARDAMPGGGELTLSADNIILDERQAKVYPDAKPGPYVVLTVTDTGTGMAPEVAVKIFEPFFTTKGIGKGTGLGLSTVNGIVKGHRGFINVYSEPGRGSSFKVYLPAAVKGAGKGDDDDPLTIPSGDGELILVIDDEAAIRQVTKGTLETYGYRVITADDGLQAEELFLARRDDVRLVITDMMMPHRTGPETIRAIRALEPTAKIIVASGLLALDEDSQRAIRSSSAFLLKPYSAEKLLLTVGRVLGKTGSLMAGSPRVQQHADPF